MVRQLFSCASHGMLHSLMQAGLKPRKEVSEGQRILTAGRAGSCIIGLALLTEISYFCSVGIYEAKGKSDSFIFYKAGVGKAGIHSYAMCLCLSAR